jgi:nitrate reductase gamma subunit
MRGLYSLFLLLFLICLAFFGAYFLKFHLLMGVIIPYVAIGIFIIGIIYRVIKWARSPVPFRIPTTCGQQKSLSWIKPNNLETPHNLLGVIGRMLLEILFFRSLFRNTKTEIKDGRLIYGENLWLWLAGLAFHWTFLIIVLRHFRFFTEPVVFFVPLIQNLDGLMQIYVPVLYMTDVIFLVAVGYLFLRRAAIAQVRYISLESDYFPLFLIFSIGLTGVLMRYFPSLKVDIIAIKTLMMGLINFNPVVPEGIGWLFYTHLFLVSVLLIYFPMSKLMHMAGVFLSPTRNLVNNNRIRRHINPWNYPVKVHTYQEYEDEFRDVMKEAGMPLEKE